MPSSGAPTSRATSSATSCSRPKKYGASATSNDARPLNGHTTGASSSPSGASRSRAACSSTMPPASSSSIERSSARPAAARSATAPTRRAASRRAHSARELVDAERHAAAARRAASRPARPRRRAPGRSAWRWRGRPRGRAAEQERAVGRTPRQGVVAAGEDQQQHGHVGDGARHRDERGEHVAVGPVRVVDDDQGRARGLAGADQRAEHGLGRPGAGGVDHGAPGRVDLPGQLGRQPALADPALAVDRHERAGAHAGVLPALAQPRQLGGAARRAAAPRRRRARAAARPGQLGARATRPGAGSPRAGAGSSGPGSTPISATSTRRASL